VKVFFQVLMGLSVILLYAQILKIIYKAVEKKPLHSHVFPL